MERKKTGRFGLFILLVGLILSGFCIASETHTLGISQGSGKPNNLKGYRVNYNYKLYQKNRLSVFLDLSYAKWKVEHDIHDKLHIIAVAPIIRINLFKLGYEYLYFEASAGPALRSNRQLANSPTGSKWTFQDILGFGLSLNQQKLDFKVRYIHYSNAKLAKPNPGTEIIPLISLEYRF